MTCKILELTPVSIPAGVYEAIDYIKSKVTTCNELRFIRTYIEAKLIGVANEGSVDEVLSYPNAQFDNRDQWALLRVLVEVSEREWT